jgi:sortase A
VLYIVGALLLLHAGVGYARAAIARDAARAEWEALDARRAVLGVHASLDRGAEPGHPLRRGAPVARLLIPKLGLDEVVVEGVEAPELNAGPGHLPGSVLPGERGNSVISAHRDRHFHGLDRVSVGDTIATETARERVTWVITHRQVLHRAAPALFETREPTLTLTTCWPVRYLGPAPERLLLTATLVSRAPRA